MKKLLAHLALLPVYAITLLFGAFVFILVAVIYVLQQPLKLWDWAGSTLGYWGKD